MAKKAASAPAPEPVEQPEVQQAPAPEPVQPAADDAVDPPADPVPQPPTEGITLPDERCMTSWSAPATAPTEVESLAAYAARIEEAAQPLPVCQITHPDAANGGLHVGRYAGIRLVRGDTPAALLSDGSTI